MDNNTFNLSANIENGWAAGTSYIPTANARKVAASIVNGFHSGMHSFTLIGTYGTGKSSFLLALESDLKQKSTSRYLIDRPNVLSQAKRYEILNIVGDYAELSTLLARKLGVESGQENVLDALKSYYERCHNQGVFLLIVIDEFGKVLEHAAEKNPNKELYFLQKLAEFANVTTINTLLITTLHQNFSAYGKRLSEAQKNEWTKVKGRFQEIVFVEPVEQIMFLAAKQVKVHNNSTSVLNLKPLQELALKTKYVSESYTLEAAKSLSPLDPFSAYTLTKAIQRYGQNERSLFTFLSTKGKNAFSEFIPQERLSYNLEKVYNYIENNFYSYLQDANADSMAWSGMRTAIERVEGSDWNNDDDFTNALKLVKAIGLLNLFGTAAFRLSIEDLSSYAMLAMNIPNAQNILKRLIDLKIIRFAEYKSRLLLFEGTDVNIEDELAKASLTIPRPVNYIDDIWYFFSKRISLAKSSYYHKGTPRYFKYDVLIAPEDITPKDDIDGYIELLFPTNKDAVNDVLRFSAHTDKALIFVVFNNTNRIVDHIYNINKYDYMLQKVLIDTHDTVAINEVNNLKGHEMELLNKAINEVLYSYGNTTTWIYKGKERPVNSQRDFNRLLSKVCNDVYSLTPTMNNELFNRHKLSGSISSAKAKYIDALVEHSDLIDLGFPADKFPPEKTIYYSLLKDTGLHKDGTFREAPTNSNIASLWQACESFMESSVEKPRKISELQQILLSQPYKLKQGFLDFWIPTYLFIKRQDYSLYDVTSGAYIPNLNREFFDMLPKHPVDYAVKTFNVSGVQMDFYNQYRRFINVGEAKTIKGDTFIETIKPFLFFYKKLNDYAKHTRKFNHESTISFRDVLAKAKDPQKAFFEDLPAALGYNKDRLANENFVKEYCERIQCAVRDLRSCYNNLIDRIESRLVDALSLSSYEYDEYILEIRQRLGSVKTYLLTDKQREFYTHVMTEFDNRKEWYQSICYTAMDQSLERLRDEQEERLENNLIFLFRECERYASISRIATDTGEEAFSFGIVSNEGDSLQDQTFILPPKEKDRSVKLEEEISKLLTGNDSVDICTLLRIIKSKAKK